MISIEPEVIEIEGAEYLGAYEIKLIFNDGKSQIIDFNDFLLNAKNPMTAKYRNEKHFQNFKIEYGDLIWNDYEMCFPVSDLYNGKI